MMISRGSLYASALREELHLKGRADLQAIAQQFHLSIRERDLAGCDGALLRSAVDSRGIIVVKSSIREFGRKRFTIGHEIGHLVLHGASAACAHSEVGNWSRTAKQTEKEADEFAAELLMPTKEIGAVINSSAPSLQIIQGVAREYEASLSACAWRYCDVVDVPCAVVWSTNEIIQWSRKSDSFRYFLQRNVEVPQASYAMAAFKGKKLPGDPEPVAAHEWIESPRLHDGAEIWEQSLLLPSYESVMTLLWIKREIAKEGVPEDDSLLEELDPEEFTLRRKRWPGKH
jgi:Zn-dependent peptidase ImmA (M78 family)